MKIMIGYATSEGQTRKIARFAADHLNAKGHSVELLALEDADDPGLDRFDAVVLAGSIHMGGYQKPLVQFAKAHAAALSECRDLFLSVSLSAAGDDAEDWEGVRKSVAELQAKTGWNPDAVDYVAGAFRFTEYNLFEKVAMRRIAREKASDIDTTVDTEYTDWARLADRLDAWVSGM